jgi:RNA polymerase sporulation-specific sigma factor
MNEPISQRKSTESHSFPEERAEIERLLLALRSPEDTPADEDAFGSLMERYLPLIEKTVDRFIGGKLNESDREDLRQEALLSFFRAAMAYDLSQKNVTFGLYAQICMTNRLISVVRKLQRPEGALVPLEEGEELRATEPSSDPTAALAEEERLESTYTVIRRVLSTFEYKVWEHYDAGHTAREIGIMLGKSEKSISNAVGRIRQKLKDARSQFDF